MTNLKDLAMQEMEKTSSIILGYPWHDAKAYGMWLSQTYYMVCHSTRLVALAGAYCALDKNVLHARFVDHSKEERGHEKVCVADVQALGYQLNDFPQLYQSAAMYQVQYYWIQHRHPTSFFGYTLALECLAATFGPRLHQMVNDAHGPKASRFLKLHSEDDVEHTQAAYEQIKSLGEAEQLLVKENLLLSSEIYRAMLIDSKARSSGLTIKKAA
jgi:hypothetical protein